MSRIRIPSSFVAAAFWAMLSVSACGPRVGAPNASLAPLFDAYFKLQAALVKGELEPAKAAYGEVRAAVGQVPAPADAARWKPLSEAIAAAGEKGAAAAKLEDARAAFKPLSDSMIEVARRFGHSGQSPLALVHCPMALGDQGAHWLQKGEAIENPYYGESMLTCGVVRESLDPAGTP